MRSSLTGLEGDNEAMELSLHVINELCLYCKTVTVGDRAVLMKCVFNIVLTFRALEQKEYLFSNHLHHCLHRPISAPTRSLIYSVLEHRVSFGLTSFRRYVQECDSECILTDVIQDIWSEVRVVIMNHS